MIKSRVEETSGGIKDGTAAPPEISELLGNSKLRGAAVGKEFFGFFITGIKQADGNDPGGRFKCTCSPP